MNRNFFYEITDRIGLITFDLPGSKVNVLNPSAMEELDLLLDEINSQTNRLKGVIFHSGKTDNFIAGADINIIENLHNEEDAFRLARQGQKIMNRINGLPMPTVAAIHGAALGGGLELALACNYRVVSDSPKTFLGLPETKLGIVPGFGGTQRLPRLVGIIQALTMITTGSRIFAKKAKRIGLADDIVPKENLLVAAGKLIASHQPGKRRKSSGQSLVNRILEATPAGRAIIFNQAHKKAEESTHGHYPAVTAAIDAVEKGFSADMQQGLEYEAHLLARLAITESSKNLIRVFHLREEFSKVERQDSAAIHKIGVMGAGVMGGGIVGLAAEKGLPVRLVSRSDSGIGKAMETFNSMLMKKVKKHIYLPAEINSIVARVTHATSPIGLTGSDAVIEAVAEDIDIKKQVMADIAARVDNQALLLSNTSSLSISEIARDLPHPERVAGLHFFNPVDKMPLVEIIRGEATSPATMVKLKGLARRLGKIPVETTDRPGFLVNRLLLPYLNEAARLLEEGVPIHKIDQALLEFGMPMGAFILLDMIGLDIAAHVGKILHQALGDRHTPSPLIDVMFASNRLGRKNGRGFYLYKGSKRLDDPEVGQLLSSHINSATKIEDRDLVERPILTMINEAAYCLMEGVVDGAAAIDVAMIFGAGFPPYTGGLMRHADSIGAAGIVGKLNAYAIAYGDRFTPAGLLTDMAKEGRNFLPDR